MIFIKEPEQPVTKTIAATLITGGTSDIGVALARVLLAKGVRVGLVGRDIDRLKRRRQELGPGSVDLFVADFLTPASASKLHDDVATRMPDLDAVVHAAGVWHDADSRYQGPALQATEPARIDEVMDVGLRAPIHLARCFLPDLIRLGRGRMVFMSCGFAGPHEAVGWVPYYVANLAVRHLVEALAAENRAFGIQINAVAPWFVATEPVRTFYPDDAGRALDPKDVAETIAYLLSPAAENISGQTIELRSWRDLGPTHT